MHTSFPLKAFWVGFIGDLMLQIIVMFRGDIVNLKNYFKTHGMLESMFIAGGMMFFFAHIIENLIPVPLTYLNVFIYGVLLDVLFRNLKLAETLNKTYYQGISQTESAIWGGIPFVVALWLFNIDFVR